MTDCPVATAWRLSPNRRARLEGEVVRFVVLHGTWMVSDADALARLTDPEAQVSCHYYVSRDGNVAQLVPEADVAWHAGKSFWDGVDGLNPWSLGVEIGNAGPFAGGVPTTAQEAVISDAQWAAAEPYTDAEYAAVIGLLKDVLARHGLGPEAVLGHDEVSPGRKSDPGCHFDWARLAAAGVALPRPLAAG